MNIQQLSPLWLTETDILSDIFMIKFSRYISISNFLDFFVPHILSWTILFKFFNSLMTLSH